MIKQLAKRFFRWFCHPDYYDEIAGDLEEMYERNKVEGYRLAQWKYFFQVMGLFRPSLIRSFPQLNLNQPTMFRHYFNISTRVLLKHKFYTAIDILGLAVGMGVCLLIYQYIHFELSYDQFHEDAENIYRLTQTTIKNGEKQGTGVYTTYGLGPSGKENIPGVEEFVRIRTIVNEGPIIINPESQLKFLENEVWYVDSTFLKVFNFPLIYGKRESALNQKHNIVISRKMSEKYFGEINPIGKELRISLGLMSGDYIVTGVLNQLPVNSHLQFDFLIPMAFFRENYIPYYVDDSKGWALADYVTYLKLHENGDIGQVSDKLSQLMATHALRDAERPEDWKIELQPLTDIHLKSNFPNDPLSSPGSIQNVAFFSIIGVFILLMAWVNYINLSTARAMHRAKEVGVRKTMGAIKSQLVSQFMTESIVINVLAALLSIGIAFSMLPMLNNILGRTISFTIFQSMEFWGFFSLAILVGSLLSGLYPAFVLSSFKPVSVLKSSFSMFKRGFDLRRGLIAFQFLISLLLISGTYLVYQQITFMKNQDLGMDMEKILVLNGPRLFRETLKEAGLTEESKQEVFRNKLLAHHSITSFSFASSIPGKEYFTTEGFRNAGKTKVVENVSTVIVDTAFADTYELEFLARTVFDVSSSVDRAIVNEESVKAFGFGSAEEALHQVLINNWGEGDSIEIVGVVKNIHWSSLKDAHAPTLFILHNYAAYFSIRMNMSDIPASIAHIESAYHEVFPDDPFEYFFLDDAFNQQYQADLQFRNLFSAFSALAIFIACIGLFALVSYSATLRIKEIGIRKVLGAGVGHLMMLLSREYLMLLLFSIGLSVPAILFGGKAWLENYAYQVGISIDLFLIPVLTLLLISFLTVCYRTYATAKANPVDALKME
ncbi:FtsX-like permease family protein [Catalinimonas sp. 4WD22]|uniref:ABC transporter permease n=1 Tax=Catalinimonas locisalis TaxID=3133978 RepID=UPI00310101FB